MINYVKGTAGEACRMSKFNKLVGLVGLNNALEALKPYLAKAGITVEQFQAYMAVKTVFQSDVIPMTQILKEQKEQKEQIEVLARDVMLEEFAFQC